MLKADQLDQVEEANVTTGDRTEVYTAARAFTESSRQIRCT